MKTVQDNEECNCNIPNEKRKLENTTFSLAITIASYHSRASY